MITDSLSFRQFESALITSQKPPNSLQASDRDIVSLHPAVKSKMELTNIERKYIIVEILSNLKKILPQQNNQVKSKKPALAGFLFSFYLSKESRLLGLLPSKKVPRLALLERYVSSFSSSRT